MIRTTGAPSGVLELPPLVQTAQGAMRRVGVEIEFARLGARQAAKALATELGGTVIKEDHHAFVVRGTCLGDMTAELDLRHVHPQRHDAATRLRLGRRSAAWLGSILSPMVPYGATMWMRWRIASPELFLDVEPLPHLICSPLLLGGSKSDEVDQHDDAG